MQNYARQNDEQTHKQNIFFIEPMVFFSGVMIQPSHPPQPSREPFEKAYKVGPVLGKGGFGIVYAGVRNRDGLQVAIKHIAKAKIKDWGQVSLLAFVQFIKYSCGKILILSYNCEN